MLRHMNRRPYFYSFDTFVHPVFSNRKNIHKIYMLCPTILPCRELALNGQICLIGKRDMKTKLVGILMITLIFMSMLSTAFLVQQSFARDDADNPANGNLAENLSQATSSSNGVASQGVEQVQGQKTTNQSQTPSNEDKWNFSDPNFWTNSTYVFGNMTRLVVGVDHISPSNLVTFQNITVNHEAKIVNKVMIGKELRALVVEIPMLSVVSYVADVKSVSCESYVEPVMKVQALFVPNDPLWSSQWGPQKVGADWAWNATMGSNSVLVAVIDTGIDYMHPDLAANYVPLGYDWANNDPDPRDDFGHGTHCAGIIAAVLNNGVGIAGLAQVRIMSEKVLDNQGGGYSDWLASGIAHAVDQGANVLSISLGGYGDSEIVHDAIKYAYSRGVLIVAAAGNDNSNVKPYPGGYDEVVAVAATDQNDNKASFSNWGDWIELAAPGVSVLSTMPTYHVTLNDYGYSMNYDYLSGTSMACPHVSGIAALVWSQYANRTRDWLRMWLRYTADDLGDPGFDEYYGYGRVDARRAVEQASLPHELAIFDSETPPYVEPGTTAVINATVYNFGQNDESDVGVKLYANDTLVDTASIGLLSSLNSSVASLAWSPTVEGSYNVTVYVEPVQGETNLENNVLSKFIAVGTPVKAVVLRSAGNVYGEIIANWQVLNTQWQLFGTQMVWIDYTTLNKESITYEDIAGTEADVLIISCASNWEFTASEVEAITRYVHEGHGLIITAGTFYNAVPGNSKLAPLVGIKDLANWQATYTDFLQLLNTSHPIFDHVPSPLILPQVGTAVPSGGVWDSSVLAGGKYVGIGHFQESAIVTYKGLVYISPWLEVIPAYYQHPLQLFYNAIIWSRYQRPPHDLSVSLQCPSHLRPSQSVLVNATVENLGANNETGVEVSVLVNGEPAANLTIPTLVVGELETLSYLWTPNLGTYNITAYAPPVTGEEETFNNVETTVLTVSSAPVIGFIETHQESLHSDDLKFYYQSLGYIVDTIRSELTPELLTSYDVLMVGEDWVNTPWSTSEIAAVQSFIDSGKGFVGIGDELASSVQTILLGYGIAYTGYSGNSGPSDKFDHSHPIMEGVNYIYASYPVNSLQTLNPGYWIANDFNDAHMLIAGAETRGYVLCLSDDFASDLYEFDNRVMFANIIPWMALRPEHDLATSLVAPTSLELGDSTWLSVTVRNRGSNNETGANLYLLINDTVERSEENFTINSHESSTIDLMWVPTKTGNYNITAYAPPVPGEEKTDNNNVTKMVCVFFYTRIYLPQRWVGGGVPMGWHADDASWQYTLPFDFPFYGIKYSTVFISSNGLITFTNPDSSFSNSIPALAQKLAMAPAWDDWVTYDPCDIYIWQTTTQVGIRWFVAAYSNRSISANFEAILGSDGLIQFDYAFSDGSTSTTIGISNGVGHILAEDSTNLNYSSSILFVPFEPEHELSVTLEAPASLTRQDSALLNYTVENKGLNGETNVQVYLFLNGSLASSTTVPELDVGQSFKMSYVWTPAIMGDYNVTAYAQPLLGEENVADNVMTIWSQVQGIHDVAVTNVEPSSHQVLVGDPVDVNVSVENEGDYAENFTVTAYASQGTSTMKARITSSGTRIYLDPSEYIFNSKDVSVGYRFNVTLRVADVENLCSFQLSTCYNESMINATRWFEPTSDPEYVFYNEPTVTAEDFRTGKIMVFAGLIGNQPSFNGDGKLCIIEFEIVNLPPPGIKYSCPLGINNGETFLLDTDVNEIPAAKEDGYYEVSSGSHPGGYVIGSVVVSLGPGETMNLVIPWDTRDMSPGDYRISGYTSAVPGETHVEDNLFSDGVVSIFAHDVAVVDVTPYAHWVYQGLNVNISVEVENKGSVTENVTVTLYYNITAHQTIGMLNTSVLPGENQTVTFTWNTIGVPYCHNYTITAVASIPLDSNPEDNTLAGGGIKVRIMGDLNGDGKVDGRDISSAAWSFGSYPGHPRWNPDADINADGKIDGKDIVKVARNFGTCAA